MSGGIHLPYPPSANRLWRNFKGRSIKSAAYRKWISVALGMVLQQGPDGHRGSYHFEMTAWRPDRRKRDLSNLIKPVEDALVLAGVIEDDSLAQSIKAEWGAGIVKGGDVLVVIRQGEPH